MEKTSKQYVDFHDEGYWIAGTRISLDSIVYAYRDGFSPEAIVRECFPSLNFEQVYGAIAHYLANKDEIDTYLKGSESKFEALRKKSRETNAELYRKLTEAKQRSLTHS